MLHTCEEFSVQEVGTLVDEDVHDSLIVSLDD